MSQEPNKNKNDKSDWIEEVEVAGSDLVDRVKDLVKEGNVRRLIIRNANNDVLIEVPLTPAVVVGGVATIIAPILAALGALAALIARVKIEVVRIDTDDDGTDTIEISSDDVND
jgi:phage-related minor tail protein